jgi:hypothetical protein
LKAERKHIALFCESEPGPTFIDIGVSGNGSDFTSLGYSYTKDAGLDKYIVFAGSQNYQLKEIEVFEITA